MWHVPIHLCINVVNDLQKTSYNGIYITHIDKYIYIWIPDYIGDIFSNMNSIAAIQTEAVFVLFKKTVFNQ